MAEVQAKTFKHELFLFKKSAAASAKVTNQLGDDDIRKKFDNVFYALQDFALSTPHGSSIGKLNWEHVFEKRFTANSEKTTPDSPTRPKPSQAPTSAIYPTCPKTIRHKSC